MAQEVYWTTKDGRRMNVDDMDNNHVRNAFKMLIRNVEQLNKRIVEHNAEITKKKANLFTINGDIALDQMEQEMFNDEFGDDLEEFYGL